MRMLDDDTEVQALCERLGCWPVVAAEMAKGHSGFVHAGNWAIAFYHDGLLAVECDTPLQAGAIALGIAAQTIPIRDVRIEVAEPVAVH